MQGSLEFATQLQVLLRLLLPCVSLSGASLSTVGGGDPGKADLVRLQVAALQAVREFIIYRYSAPPRTEILPVWSGRHCSSSLPVPGSNDLQMVVVVLRVAGC